MLLSCTIVVVQLYPWFKRYFPFFWRGRQRGGGGVKMCGIELKTKLIIYGLLKSIVSIRMG